MVWDTLYCFLLKKVCLKVCDIVLSPDQEKHFQKKAERHNDHLKFKAARSSDMKLV